MRRVAITGIGAVTPLGHTASDTWDALVAGRSGIGPLTTFDTSTFDVRIGGQVRDFRAAEGVDRRLARVGQYGVAATREALAVAGITAATYTPADRGVAIGGSVGRPELQTVVDVAQLRESTGARQIYRHAPRDVLYRNQNAAVAAIADVADAAGPMISVSTACAGSGHAIGEAFRHIQEGDAAMMVAGGMDTLTTWMDVLGFSLLGALTTEYNDRPGQASRPFDARRSGFVIGEGAVVVVLEEMSAARARGAGVLAELLGYSSTLNAYRITDSPPDGGGAIPAMANALADARVAPGDIDYVVAHGTGTLGNDLSETVAVRTVFGEHADRLVLSSPKSMTGHLTSGAAALNVLAAVGALRTSTVPPTINLDYPDPKLDLDYVPNIARSMRVDTALVNAFAFGGTNTCLVVGKAEE
ncbi:3-oxoacyl-[acyl-carrier-protein] synthase II [Nocardia tenerifensis]|uniref:3-oxoacyl-[acyl-carrier-protein] synthase II n=1 Tax=Nocardia tenerifensis TaxID=228006 RepID=A0A318JTJ1_9NOCA|nr:beta-ketoacyl-[acyl-carrier-protein] synthase family protein [Nocardia tenerifensis]PXX55549.1 3-oxoacyl-[acyl-carrier-protein] synthase II [Nocardia tenerifensis]